MTDPTPPPDPPIQPYAPPPTVSPVEVGGPGSGYSGQPDSGYPGQPDLGYSGQLGLGYSGQLAPDSLRPPPSSFVPPTGYAQPITPYSLPYEAVPSPYSSTPSAYSPYGSGLSPYLPSGQAYPAAPYQYAYSPYGPPGRPTDGLAIASLIVSCTSVLALCAYGLGALVGATGAILGHVARRRIRASGAQGDGMALAGIVVGWITTGLGVLGIAFLITVIATDAFGSGPS